MSRASKNDILLIIHTWHHGHGIRVEGRGACSEKEAATAASEVDEVGNRYRKRVLDFEHKFPF